MDVLEMKMCTKCGVEKEIGEFSKNQYKCKYCNKEYREQNKDKVRENNKKWYEQNKEKILEQSKEKHKHNKMKDYYKERYNKNKEKEALKSKKYHQINKIKINEQRKYYRIENKEKIKEACKKWNNKIALYDNYSKKLIDDIFVNIDDPNDLLLVKCKNCNEWFKPTNNEVRCRVYALNTNDGCENNFYCSDECKNTCSIFKKKLYREGENPNKERPYQDEWSKMIIERDNYECQICGSKENLVAHHIVPVKINDMLQADIDNGICLCSDCHSKYGHKDECSTGQLAKRIC